MAITYLIPVPSAMGVRESLESVSITCRRRKQKLISCRTEAIKSLFSDVSLSAPLHHIKLYNQRQNLAVPNSQLDLDALVIKFCPRDCLKRLCLSRHPQQKGPSLGARRAPDGARGRGSSPEPFLVYERNTAACRTSSWENTSCARWAYTQGEGEH